MGPPFDNLGIPVVIEINHGPPRGYTAGSGVQGIVWVEARKCTNRVFVSFTGRCQTSIEDSFEMVHNTYATLFTMTTDLFTGSDICTSMASEELEGWIPLQFTFRFPRTVDLGPPTKGDSHSVAPNTPPFADLPGHLLPPSLECFIAGQHQCILYEIEATMFTPKSSKHSHRKRSVRLNYSPPCVEALPDPQFQPHTQEFTCTTHALSATEKRSLRSRLFKGSSAPPKPWASFSIAVNIPTTGQPGRAIPITFSITHLDRSADLPHPPPILLTKIRAHLTLRTSIRVLEFAKETPNCKDLTTRADIVRHNFLEPPLLHDGIRLDDILPTEMIAKMTMPSFSTYSFARDYEIEMSLQVQCAGKTFEIKTFKTPFVILPLFRQGSEAMDDIPPPPYTSTEDTPPPPAAYSI